jgi:hypothetical protein
MNIHSESALTEEYSLQPKLKWNNLIHLCGIFGGGDIGLNTSI